MRNKLVKWIKYTPFLLKLIQFLSKAVFSLWKLATPVSEKRILFVSFGGKSYSDSPKEIYEAMLKDDRFSDYEFVWAFISEPKDVTLSNNQTKVIKIDTIIYFFYVLSSKYWITNSSVERSFNLKQKKTIYINTWHGTPLKKMGIDIKNTQAFGDFKKMTATLFLAQSLYEIDIFSRVFMLEKERFALVGLPRNDLLKIGITEKKISEIKQMLKIDEDKKVILYAPTFREFRIKNGKYVLDQEIDWIYHLTEEYIVLLRGHYEITDMIKESHCDPKIIDVGDYAELNELMAISDMLITDYSSIMFDYSILKKPILLYIFDYEEYNAKRGIYFDIREYLPYAVNPDELLYHVYNTDRMDLNKIEHIRKTFVQKYGKATQEFLEIFLNLQN